MLLSEDDEENHFDEEKDEILICFVIHNSSNVQTVARIYILLLLLDSRNPLYERG
jgi:hypothetical protein